MRRSILTLAFASVWLTLGIGLARADKVVLVAGGGVGGDGPPAQARLGAPFGVDFDSAGNLYLVEMTGQRVRRLDPAGMLTTVAGLGRKGDAGDGGPAAKAEFNGMHGLAVGPDGAVFLADTWNNRIRRLDPKTGTITAIAGTGRKGCSGDGGPAVKAEFGGIYSVAIDPKGKRLVVADLDNRRVRVIDLESGLVDTVAGNGVRGVPADGAEARNSPLVDPRAACFDASGNVYVLERGGHALRRVDPAGRIKTVVGTGKKGFDGDGGDALKAALNGPKHLCVDRDGTVLIADTENHVIRRFHPADGRITRVAGTGKKGAAGLDGPPLSAEFNQPHGVYVHPSGVLYISDSSNHRVVKIVK
jgi:sugar lactone lactonase YvrE